MSFYCDNLDGKHSLYGSLFVCKYSYVTYVDLFGICWNS